MAEVNCAECDRLHESYSAATIRYMKFYEGKRTDTQESQKGNHLFTEMNDAMLALSAHQVSGHSSNATSQRSE